MKAHQVFTVFFGIFWAAALASVAKFRPFETHHLIRNPTLRAWRRLIGSVLLLNVTPLAWYWLMATHVVPGEEVTGGWAVISGGFAAITVFGFTRIFFGVFVGEPFWALFYTPKEHDEILSEWRKHWSEEPREFWDHVAPGVLYMAFFFTLACLSSAWAT